MEIIANKEAVERVLEALGEQLAATGDSYELVVIGGSGLLMLGAIDRATRDIDLVALRSGSALTVPDPLPDALREARDRIARDFSLPLNWLNSGPASLLDLGLPEGFLDRVESRDFGDHLTVHFASRFDPVHFKLYASVDAGPGKHSQDLEALVPTPEELLQAARWTRTHDPSPGFEEVLRRVLAHYGVENADL
jgi:Nucleotidyltransferase of unknown function (DUF6036)